MTHTLHIVDVFAEHRYEGNQLAVVIGKDPLDDQTMQRIAVETNYSETTFVTSEPMRDGGYNVRIFTPAREIDFAGHPILGTAWVIRRHLVPDNPGQIKLNLSVGGISVAFETTGREEEILWFDAPPMTLGQQCGRQPMALGLGLQPEDIDTFAPVQQVSAGTSAMIVPIRNLDALRRSRLDLAAYTPLTKSGFPPLVYLFCRETREAANDLSVRFFFEAHGVREDPATGNGAAFLGTYLLEHSIFPTASLDLRIEQGHWVNRPSLVRLRARSAAGTRVVRVGGRVIPTFSGDLL